jgi:hypothetical protein
MLAQNKENLSMMICEEEWSSRKMELFRKEGRISVGADRGKICCG